MGIVKKNGIMIVDFALHRLDEGYDLRERDSRSERRTFSSNHHDDAGGLDGRGAARSRLRRGWIFASPAWAGYCRRPDHLAIDHALHHAGDLSLAWSGSRSAFSIAFHSSAALTFTSTISRTNVILILGCRSRPARGNVNDLTIVQSWGAARLKT